MFQLNLPSTWDVTANNFNRRHFQMCFAGPSMGNSADADQMLPDVAFYLGLHCLISKTNYWPQVLHAWRYDKLTILYRLFILKANLTEC